MHNAKRKTHNVGSVQRLALCIQRNLCIKYNDLELFGCGALFFQYYFTFVV